ARACANFPLGDVFGRGIEMKRFTASALLAALGLCAGASAEPRYQGPLSWMVGCWQSADKTNTEVWTAPLGGMMFGYAATIKDGTLTYYEQAHIDLRPPRPIY